MKQIENSLIQNVGYLLASNNTSEKDDHIILQVPIISYARALRKKSTRAEKKLWPYLRNRRFHNYKFRRQHPISNRYILDFYCDEKKLAVELDGMYHKEPRQKYRDDERTNELAFLGINVIRFDNDEVIDDIENVLKKNT